MIKDKRTIIDDLIAIISDKDYQKLDDVYIQELSNISDLAKAAKTFVDNVRSGVVKVSIFEGSRDASCEKDWVEGNIEYLESALELVVDRRIK